ncbi:MAG: hypothetical protein IPF57_02480 [Gammaproteobacteria bacterium]|nr:hypothetical protein [Gammaproteobacteria bacterium]MBK8990893.1 hypothetical protein [Gammaproteobacteria bacterium]
MVRSAAVICERVTASPSPRAVQLLATGTAEGARAVAHGGVADELLGWAQLLAGGLHRCGGAGTRDTAHRRVRTGDPIGVGEAPLAVRAGPLDHRGIAVLPGILHVAAGDRHRAVDAERVAARGLVPGHEILRSRLVTDGLTHGRSRPFDGARGGD